MEPDQIIYTKGNDRPTGELNLIVRDGSGKVLDPFSAGIFRNPAAARALGGIRENGETPIGENLVVNLGRQTIANLIGARDLIIGQPNPWAVTQVSWGIFPEAPRFTDTTLSPQPEDLTAGGANQILYNGTDALKPISRVDWPQAFVIRFECNLAVSEGNGYLLQEMGLWTNNGSLFARKAMIGVQKQPGHSLTWLWSIRT